MTAVGKARERVLFGVDRLKVAEAIFFLSKNLPIEGEYGKIPLPAISALPDREAEKNKSIKEDGRL